MLLRARVLVPTIARQKTQHGVSDTNNERSSCSAFAARPCRHEEFHCAWQSTCSCCPQQFIVPLLGLALSGRLALGRKVERLRVRRMLAHLGVVGVRRLLLALEGA